MTRQTLTPTSTSNTGKKNRNVLYNDQLLNSGNATEEAWFEGLLGNEFDKPGISRIGDRISGWSKDTKLLVDYDLGFKWNYAVVKYGRYCTELTPDDNGHLTTPMFKYGISHISFFDPLPDPEPASMFLLSGGLIGLAGYGRKNLN